MNNLNKSKRNTVQKALVFEVFGEMKNHPSAGMVYDRLHEKYPNVSRATVYRLLAEAAEGGEIQRLRFGGSADRYDFTTSEHYHFKCRECGGVFDADDRVSESASKILRDAVCGSKHKIEGCRLEFYGICKNCRENI